MVKSSYKDQNKAYWKVLARSLQVEFAPFSLAMHTVRVAVDLLCVYVHKYSRTSEEGTLWGQSVCPL